MTKTYKFNYIDEKYTLTYSQPGKEGDPFAIDEEKMEFDTTKFYQYVFQDVNDVINIKIDNEMNDDDIDRKQYKKGMRVLNTIEDLCKEICEGINEECFKIKSS